MGKRINIRSQPLIGLLITLASALLMYFGAPPLETIEAKLYDYRFKFRGPLNTPAEIVIAAIDEKSIEKLGRFPWSRDRLAALVKRLNGAGAEIIAFDIILSEDERNDPVLAEAIGEAGNVILPIVFDFESELPGAEDVTLLNSAFASVSNQERFRAYPPIMASRVLLPVPSLLREVMSLGAINMFPDKDGTLRWETLAIRYRDRIYPAITLQTAAAYLGVPRENITVEAARGIRVGSRYIPTDWWGRMLINYYGTNLTFPHIPVADILEGKAVEELRGKIVLVGATAVGIYDLRVTPFSPAMPGIEKHASVIASILENRPIRALPVWANLLALIVTGAVFSLAVGRLKAASASALTAGALAAIFLSGYYPFANMGIWVNIAYPSLNILLIFVTVTAYNFAVEERYGRKIRGLFSSYVTERVVSELIKNPALAKLGGERREVTVLFSDIRGFTTFSEKHPPEEVVAILNEYLGVMTEAVFRWEGTLDKFIGDAILAFWGAPLHQENHAELAVRCSLDMIERLRTLRKKWEAEGKGGLDIGIGINSGEVIVGNIGAEGKKMDYTVIGDHVNLGARVESLTRNYDAHILITEFTLEKIRPFIEKSNIGHVSVTGIEKVVVKGKEEPVGIYAIESIDPNSRSFIIDYEAGKVARFHEK